jgi:hypothetical protein
MPRFTPSFEPAVFQQASEDGVNKEVAATDFDPFNVIIVNNGNPSVIAAQYDFRSRQYIYGDTLPASAVVEVSR